MRRVRVVRYTSGTHGTGRAIGRGMHYSSYDYLNAATSYFVTAGDARHVGRRPSQLAAASSHWFHGVLFDLQRQARAAEARELGSVTVDAGPQT